MGFSGGNARLRREDCEYVKHDKLFSKWKILVGPSDWSEGMGRSSGTGRYQMQNVPTMEFGPGVLELGVTAPSWSPAAQRAQPLKTQDVIPVYVGQAGNIRQRLHKFGQAAAHLEPGSRSGKLYQGDEASEMCSGSTSTSVQSGGGEAKSFTGSGLRLFSEVFALGSSIAFRWAHADSKVVAEQVVAELLAVFDYAWNKAGSNGARRSRDILAKLFMAWPTTQDSRSLSSLSKRSWLRKAPVGIKVALRKPHDPKPKTLVGKNLCFVMTLQPQVPFKSRRQQHVDRMKKLRKTPSLQLDQRKQANYLIRWTCFPPRSNKRAARNHVTDEQPRRPYSLSFNTWVKMETDDQRVHNHGDVKDSGVKGSDGMVSKRRVRSMRSIYALIMPADDAKRG